MIARLFNRGKVRLRVRAQARAFAAWQEQNPDRRFRDYYVDRVSEKLEAGLPHPTLGRNLSGADESRSGQANFEFLLGQGIEPQHVCVDFGCGSLRVGRLLMAYLEPGHYWGLDLSFRFIEEGTASLEPAFMDRRRPNLRIIDEASLGEVRRARADFLISIGVLIHVPPAELDDYLSQLMSCLGNQTRAFVTARTSKRATQYSALSWSHEKSSLEAAVHRHGGRCRFEADGSSERATGLVLEHWWVEITR